MDDEIFPSQRVSAAELADMERDRQAHERPNEPWRADDVFDECADSKYFTHQFSARTRDGEACCTFCGRRFSECLKVT